MIVEEQSDNFGQSSKGQASQTEAQRQTSGFGRLCRKIVEENRITQILS